MDALKTGATAAAVTDDNAIVAAATALPPKYTRGRERGGFQLSGNQHGGYHGKQKLSTDYPGSHTHNAASLGDKI